MRAGGFTIVDRGGSLSDCKTGDSAERASSALLQGQICVKILIWKNSDYPFGFPLQPT